jgi:hypothetical protein
MPARPSGLPRAPGLDDWLTTRETAEMSRLSLQTLANYRWQGVGPAYTKLRPGRSGPIRYRRRDVEQWLAGETAQAA